MIMDQHMADVDADVDVDVDVDVDIEVEAADQRPQSQPQPQSQTQSQPQSPSRQRQQPQSQQSQPQQHQLHPRQQSPTQPQPTTPLIRATSPTINVDGVNSPPGTGTGGTPQPTTVPLSPHHHLHPQAHKIGPLWIRRQLFEHSVAVPILTTANATQIDFSRLAAELHAASVTKPPAPPAVTYDDWVAAAGLYARLDSSEHAAIIVEALETNAPDAFLRCNGNDAAKLNSPDHLPFRQLLIPVPELLAFLKLHAAATVSSSYRNVADSVWPMSEDLSFAVSNNHNNNINNNNNTSLQHVLGYQKSSNVLAPISLTPASPRIIQAQQPGTPTRQSPVAFAQQQGHNINNSNSNAPHNSPVSSSPPSLTKSILEAAGNEHLFSSLQAQQQQQPHTTASQSDIQAQQKQSQQQSALKQQSTQRQQPQSPSAVHSPSSQRQQTQPPSNQSSPHQQLLSSPVHASGNNFEGLVSRKKTAAHMSPVMNSQSVIMASGHHPLERETRLVVTNLKALLLVIGGAYGICIDDHAADDKAGQSKTPANRNINNNGTNGPINNNGAAESGSLTSNDKSQQQASSPVTTSAPDSSSDPTLHGQNNVISSDTGGARTGLDAVMADSNHVSSNSSIGCKGKKQSINQIRITRQMFEHLSFLFTTSSEPSGAYRSMSKIVPLWNNNKNNTPHYNNDANIDNRDRDISGEVSLAPAEHDENRGPIVDDDNNNGKENDEAIILSEMMSIVTTALTVVPTQEVIDQSGGGVIDVVDICDLERKTVVRTSMPLTNQAPLHPSDVRIVNCHDVHIYLLCSLGRVSFVGCRGCTLFVGGCVSLSLINCENVRVHAVARVVRVTNCFDTHLYLCTNNRPQIVGENRGLVFAPYNAVYPRAELNKHLEVVGVDVRRNIWDQFYQPALKCSTASTPSGNGPGSCGANSNNFNNSNNMNNNNIPGNDDNSCKNNNNNSSNNSNKQQHSNDRTPSNASGEMAAGNVNEVLPVIARKMSPDQFLPFAVPVRFLEGTIIGEDMDEISMSRTDDDSTFDNNGSDVIHGVGKEDKLSNTGAGGGGGDVSGDRIRRKWDSSLKCLFGVWVPLPSVYADNLKQKRSLVVKVREEIRDIERKWLVGNMDVTTEPKSNNRTGKGKDVAMGDKDEDEGRETQQQQVDNDSVDGSAERERQHARQMAGGIVHSIIQDRFREWLTHSGRIRQISDLFRMVQE